MDILYLLGGLAVLLVSGDFLVKGSVSLAKYLKVSKLVIAVTIVSLGTSAPELLVSLKAAISGHPDIAIGNVIGSNISNIALVLGLSSLIIVIPVAKNTVNFDWPVMMLASLLFYVFILNNSLERWEGFIFLLLLAGYITYSIMKSRRQKQPEPEKEEKKYPLALALLFIALSSVGLVFGSEWLVDGAIGIAHYFDVSEHVISVSVIAVGTSIPELATSLIAAIKKQLDISVGNIIGSNIFNIFAILGTTSVVTDIPVNNMVKYNDIFWMLGISLMLFLLIVLFKRGKLNWLKGLILLAAYITYIYMVFGSKEIVQ